jgi:general secretion pathway protein F
MVVGVANWFQAYWSVLIGGAVGLMILFLILSFTVPNSRKIWHGRWLKLPLVGVMILNKEVANVTRTLGTLLGNGVAQFYLLL